MWMPLIPRSVILYYIYIPVPLVLSPNLLLLVCCKKPEDTVWMSELDTDCDNEDEIWNYFEIGAIVQIFRIECGCSTWCDIL